MDQLLVLDKNLFLYCNTLLAHPLLDLFFKTITLPRNWVVPLILVCVWYLFKVSFRPFAFAPRDGVLKRLALIGLLIVTFALTDLLGTRILKPFFNRPRPCHPDHLIDGARYLFGLKKTLSFPSLHAMNMFGVATMLSAFYRRQWPWFMTIAALVAFSRVYCGLHYPLDIAAGAIFGAVIGTGIALSAQRFFKLRLTGKNTKAPHVQGTLGQDSTIKR